jgi:predicted component of type VI protein secretion system
MIRLQVLSGETTGRVIESREHEVRLGRASTNHLVIGDWHVSAEHAAVLFTGDGYVVRDQRSTNGTSIQRNGASIPLAELPERELRLEAGDELWLGDAEQPVRLSVTMGDDIEETQIVSVRSVEDMGRMAAEIQGNSELLRGLYEAQKTISAALDTDAVLRAVSDQVFRFLSRATHVAVVLRELDEAGRVAIWL